MEKNSVNTALAISFIVSAVIVIGGTAVGPAAVYADETKNKRYISESGSLAVSSFCDQESARERGFSNCSQEFKEFLGEPQNPATREDCEEQSGEECKKPKNNP